MFFDIRDYLNWSLARYAWLAALVLAVAAWGIHALARPALESELRTVTGTVVDTRFFGGGKSQRKVWQELRVRTAGGREEKALLPRHRKSRRPGTDVVVGDRAELQISAANYIYAARVGRTTLLEYAAAYEIYGRQRQPLGILATALSLAALVLGLFTWMWPEFSAAIGMKREDSRDLPDPLRRGRFANLQSATGRVR